MITVIFWHVDFVGSVKTVRLFFFAVHCVFVLGVIFFKALPQLDKHCSVGRSSWIHPTIHLRVTKHMSGCGWADGESKLCCGDGSVVDDGEKQVTTTI